MTSTIFKMSTLLITYILSAIGLWGVFRKSGEKSWKAIIPVYNQYTLYKIVWEGKYYLLQLLLVLAFLVSDAGAMTMCMLAELGGSKLWFGVLTVVTMALLVANLVIAWKKAKKIVAYFGKESNVGFILACFLIPNIMYILFGYSGKYKVQIQENE